MKEFAPVGWTLGEHRSKIEVESLVFSIMKGQQVDRTYGLKLTISTNEEGYAQEENCLVDQDELPELINGMTYLNEKFMQLRDGVPSYTEISYITRDDFKVGFYVNPGPDPDPKAFCSAGGSSTAFMEPKKLIRLRDLIAKGLVYLESVALPQQ